MRLSTEQFINRICEHQIPIYVKKLFLFGSEVYGCPNKNSDIDIAVISDSILTISQRCELDELIENSKPPYYCQLTYLDNTPYIGGFNVKMDVYSKGVLIYERQP